MKHLIGKQVKVEAPLLCPSAQEDEDALFPLPDIDDVLSHLLSRRKGMLNLPHSQ